MQVRRRLADARHRGLGVDLGDVARGEAIDAIVPLDRHLPVEARQPRNVRVNRPRHGGNQRVVPAALRDRLADELQVAEVVRHLVVAADVVDQVLDLDDVAGTQPLEADHLGAVVVIKPVPRLGQILVAAIGRLQRRQVAARVAPVDARLPDVDLFASRRVVNRELLVLLGAPLGQHLDDALGEGARQTVLVNAHDAPVQQHDRAAAGRVGGGLRGRRQHRDARPRRSDARARRATRRRRARRRPAGRGSVSARDPGAAAPARCAAARRASSPFPIRCRSLPSATSAAGSSGRRAASAAQRRERPLRLAGALHQARQLDLQRRHVGPQRHHRPPAASAPRRRRRGGAPGRQLVHQVRVLPPLLREIGQHAIGLALPARGVVQARPPRAAPAAAPD